MTEQVADAPLLRGYEPESVVSWYHGRPMSAQAFCGTALAMSARLPHAHHALNLCERPPCFLLGSAAAWLAAQALVLPADRLARTLTRLHEDFPDAYCIVDSPQVAQNVRDSGMVAFLMEDLRGAGEAWPPPRIGKSRVAACLHTSGSTGRPSRHAKAWGELVDGAATFLRSFGSPGPAAAILGTVAPQHMFGLETTIMLTLQSGTPLLPTQPALPGDVGRALDQAHAFGRRGIWLMTTPMQLRAFHAARVVAGLERIVTATMPLDASLAQSVERDWHVPVEEIYGCTEGGMLAHRRPATDSTFTAGDGISFAVDANGQAFAQGGHLPHAIPLADRIEIITPGNARTPQQFHLLGRDDDMVKIAGKRASLAGLTGVLCAVAGVEDGAFFRASPESGRLCAVAVAPDMDEAGLRRELAAVVDPAFLPRPLLMVDRIPRGTGMKINVAALRGRVADDSRAQPAATTSIDARMSVDAAHPVFAGHFPGRPIVPGVLLLERIEAVLAARGFVLRDCTSLKFHSTVGPDEIVDIHVEIRTDGRTQFRLTRGGNLVASGVCRCEVLSAA